MHRFVNRVGVFILVVSAFAAFGAVTNTRAEVDIHEYSSLRQTVSAVHLPEIKNPVWLDEQIKAEEEAAKARAAAVQAASSLRTVTYTVTTAGSIQADLNEFKQQANQTLNDSRGWARLGLRFQEVQSGGQFALVLAEANELANFPGCSVEWSCNSGNNVVINQDRWLGATSAWNSAGGGLRDYRHMVVNHETGHWLGHGHEFCGGAGQPAPVMQQQSVDLQGCAFNPWPLPGELWSSRLGIR